ncbi:MAG: radical SAM protein [Candidatus Lokiarchaeota archaeon]|nr:radical SAM protein [Candidatus Lokiarchaeota archaeon]MBD3338981.1 radical SAM protein [Candidatus Lokiarchaeota archaeon]
MAKEQIYYCEPVFRPPSEAHSLLIQVTEGCTYKCDFCMSNLRKKFIVRDVKDIKRDLDIAEKKFGNRVRRIFFLDGNAMITPTEKLLKITKYAYTLFPKLERCAVYAHSKDIIKKSDEQLKSLSDEGLKIAYVGFESGYDKLLKKVNKHATKEDHIEGAKKLMNANITLSATFINGLGGANNPDVSKKHAIESADLVNKICPDDNRTWYIAFLSLMIPPGTVLYEKKSKGEFKEMSSREILEELKLFVQTIDFPNKEANCVFRSNHASNYLPIKGVLERDKEKIIETINYGLSNRSALRPEFYRGL